MLNNPSKLGLSKLLRLVWNSLCSLEIEILLPFTTVQHQAQLLFLLVYHPDLTSGQECLLCLLTYLVPGTWLK